jgi:hypothetical protein
MQEENGRMSESTEKEQGKAEPAKADLIHFDKVQK